MMYSEMKKSPVAAGFLEIIPTAGYAYSENWGRGLTVKGLSVSLFVGGVIMDVNGFNGFGLGTGVAYTGIGLWFYSFYDAINQTSKYNKHLRKEIFGEERSNIGFNLYPLQDGAGITFTYSFN